ncbi:dihydrofolate reductase [Patescibacteria group bacterium]|nr:dihydrofolate reductase [Patescibacteria group bacterium]MBU1721213.1 dihydrofolate reductase [Patescibacteria group bacterium]MBU1901079.1 dihydrofolate reductase [Patescibacteria group bacterium]
MIALIAAVADNLCIGKDNKLPWNIPEDLEYFKKTTLEKTIMMGQNTFDSILGYIGKPLPNRKNVVLTFNKDFVPPEGVEVFYSIDEALAAHKDEDIFFGGGASIYKQAINIADTLYITHVHQTVDGDTFFPEIDLAIWKETWREDHDGFSFVIYKKI